MEIAIPVIGAVIQWILTTMLHIDKAFFIYGQEVRQYVVIVKVLCGVLVHKWLAK